MGIQPADPAHSPPAVQRAIAVIQTLLETFKTAAFGLHPRDRLGDLRASHSGALKKNRIHSIIAYSYEVVG